MKTVVLVLALYTMAGDKVGLMVQPGTYTHDECLVVQGMMERDVDAGLGTDSSHMIELQAKPLCLDESKAIQ